MINEELIVDKLEALRREIAFIKEHLIDIKLDKDDIDSIRLADEDLKKGKTKRL